MRPISSSVHSFLDYAVAVVLLVVPIGANFQEISPVAHWMAIAAGIALFSYSLLTNYSISWRRLIPLTFHLSLDFVAGVAFILAPFIFGFGSLAKVFYITMGVAIVAVVLLTDRSHLARRAKAMPRPGMDN
ncbi:MAG: hypothetical protein AAFR12_15210 [Cyanobacteria bacterium J06626_6]